MSALCTVAVARAACVRFSLPALPRVWCPELSVLDADFDGERVVWHVPSKPANDLCAQSGAGCAVFAPPADGFAEIPADSLGGPVARETSAPRRHARENAAKAPRATTSRGRNPAIHCRATAARQSTLAAWLREQEGSVLP